VAGAAAGEDWKVHIEFQVYSLPAKKGLPLVPELRDEGKLAQAYKKLEALAQKGEAKLSANLGGQTTHEKALKLAQVEEVRYPVEFEQAALVRNVPAQDGNGLPASVTGEAPAVSYPPTIFERRTVGITLTISVGVSEDGQRLFVTAGPEHSWLLKWDEFEAGRLANNEKIIWKQPRFAFAKADSAFGMFSGERVLLSAHPIADQPEQLELFFLKVWATPRRTPPKQ
jgi:hypothetical protein